MCEWISVDDELPSEGEVVLTWSADQECTSMGTYRHNIRAWLLVGSAREPVTHWQPLPDPPDA